MSAAVVAPEPVPLVRDRAGRLVVVGTRVPLDTIFVAFERGDSAEAVHESYPTVSLGDVYAVFTYCVRHRDEIHSYLATRRTSESDLRASVEKRFPSEGLRDRLMSRLD